MNPNLIFYLTKVHRLKLLDKYLGSVIHDYIQAVCFATWYSYETGLFVITLKVWNVDIEDMLFRYQSLNFFRSRENFCREKRRPEIQFDINQPHTRIIGIIFMVIVHLKWHHLFFDGVTAHWFDLRLLIESRTKTKYSI